MRLDGDADNPRWRYLLGTLLATLGIPHGFVGSEVETPPQGRVLRLVVDWEGIALVPSGLRVGQQDALTPRGEGVLLPHTLFSLLARAEEYEIATRDAHDRFLWEHSREGRSRSADLSPARPVFSEYALELQEALRDAAGRADLPLIRKEFWPGGKPMAACLTHDVDVVRRGKLPRGVAVRDVTAALSEAAHGRLLRAAGRVAAVARTAANATDPYWTFDRISALEQQHGYRSTYFVMAGRHHPEDALYDLEQPPIAQLLRWLQDSGCEVALHGSYGSPGDADSLRTHKSRLENCLGQAVAGHRNHFLRFRVPDSWRAQESAGFSYDATLAFADQEGFRGGHAFPFHPYDLATDRSLGLLEIPLAAMDVTLSKYRRLRGEAAWEALQGVLEQTLTVHGLATLLWHNDTFYDPDYPGSGRLYERALGWLSDHEAYVAPTAEIDRWWRARDAVQLHPLPEGRKGWSVESRQEIQDLVLRVSLSDPSATPRVRGGTAWTLRREGPDLLVELGRLPAGTRLDIEYP